MKKLLKRIMALSLCACMMMAITVSANAAPISNPSNVLENTKYRVESNNYYMNVYETSPSQVENNSWLTSWSAPDTSGCQNFTVRRATYNGQIVDIIYLRGTNYVVSYNNSRNSVVMWGKDNANPPEDYALSTASHLDNYNTFSFAFVNNNPKLAANGEVLNYGNEYGTRITPSSTPYPPATARWIAS